MGTEPLTSKPAWYSAQHWFNIIAARTQEVISNIDNVYGFHSLNWSERNKLVKKNMSRQDIVSIYENLYVELSETYAGMDDAYKEAQRERDYLTRENERKDKDIVVLGELLATANARLNGLLKIIEEPEPGPESKAGLW